MIAYDQARGRCWTGVTKGGSTPLLFPATFTSSHGIDRLRDEFRQAMLARGDSLHQGAISQDNRGCNLHETPHASFHTGIQQSRYRQSGWPGYSQNPTSCPCIACRPVIDETNATDP